MINNKNNSLKFIIKYFLAVLVFVLLVVFMKKVFTKSDFNTIDASSVFDKVDYEYIDSLILTMSLQEQVSELLLSDNNYTNDSSSFLSEKNDSAINIFNVVETQVGMPNIEQNIEFISFESFNIINDDSLKSKYFEFCSTVSLNKDFNINIINPLQEKKFIRAEGYIQNFIPAISKFHNKNILLGLSDTFLNDDSVSVARAIKNGLLCIYFTSGDNYAEKSEFLKQQNYIGIVIHDIRAVEKGKVNDTIISLINNGVDLLRISNKEDARVFIEQAINEKLIDKKLITNALRRLLAVKYWNGILKNEDEKIVVKVDNKFKKKLEILYRQFYKKSISLINNNDELLPLKGKNPSKILVITAGNEDLPEFKRYLSKYCNFNKVFIKLDDEKFEEKLFKYSSSLIILALNNIELSKPVLDSLQNKHKDKKLIVVGFGNNKNIINITDSVSYIQVFGNTKLEQHYAAELIFGGISANSNSFFARKKIKSIETEKTRISYGLPEEAGLDSEILAKIDSITNNAIYRGAFPGAQIMVIKNGIVVYSKGKGYHTYAKQRNVQNSDLYDLASLTKIMGTTLAAMKMYDTGKLGLDTELKKCFRNTNINYSNIKPDTVIHIDTLNIKEIANFAKILRKRDTLMLNDSICIAYDTLIFTATPKNNIFKVTVRDLLLHKSGVTPVLPILPYLLYKKYIYDNLDSLKSLVKDTVPAIKDSALLARFEIRSLIKDKFNEYYSHKYIKDTAERKIADGFYLRDNYYDTIWNNTKSLRVYSRKIYQYSDVNMILLQLAIDSINRKSIDKYLTVNIYKPLNLYTIAYKPLRYFSKSRITPTENDKYWREQQLRGNVHDPSAAIMGGIAGNAGLFSNSLDLGVLGQMLLNGGKYGGRRIFKESTVNLFTSMQEDSHRGLGFDKPSQKSITGEGIAPEAYGHTGFTGTCVWIDPVNDIVYVFLSNRVYPSAKNWRINTYKVRQKVHTAVYESIIK